MRRRDANVWNVCRESVWLQFVGGGSRQLGCIVFAGRATEDGVLWRRRRRRCLPGAPVLLPNVAPPIGAGNGANVTPFAGRLTAGTLRGVSGGGAWTVMWRMLEDGTTLRDGSVVESESLSGGVWTQDGCATEVRMLVSCVSTAWWLSLRGASGEPGDG